ncbi:MAG: hypothetical protein AAF354_15395, partial [Pseudomonadota bacterium]
MTDFTHDELIKRAKRDPGPGSKTHFLIEEAAKLMLPEEKRLRIWELLGVFAEVDAAIALFERALPGWDWEKFSGNMVVLREPIDTVHWKAHDYAGEAQGELARSLLIA